MCRLRDAFPVIRKAILEILFLLKEVSTLTGDRIISLLRKKGYTQRRIAQEFGVSHPAIHYVIYGKSKSRRIQERIAEIIGRPMDQVFKAA